MRYLLTFLVLLLCCAPVMAQSYPPPEYGKINELLGMHRVYIRTDDPSMRERIAKEFEKYKELEVVGRIEDAEFILYFAGRREYIGTYGNVNVNPATGNGTASSSDRYALLGNMMAVLPATNTDAIRIVWSSGKSTRFIFGKYPDIKCAQEFIKQLKKAREEEKKKNK